MHSAFAEFSHDEMRTLHALSSPRKIQDFLNALPAHTKAHKDALRSPRRVFRDKTANCIEGAMFAACALRFHGARPLLFDLTAHAKDDDHVVALFREHGCWGAISKTNHAVLRYREPVYKTLRELALSYFHEYFLDDGRKTLRSFSHAVDLSRFDRIRWMTTDEDLWDVGAFLCDVLHTPILSRKQIARLRKADAIEIAAGKLTEWPE